MCYAIPGKLIKRGETTGVIDYFGEHRNILLDDELVKVEVGDYLYAQGGVLVRKLGEEEAQEILKIWEDKFFELKKTDEALAKLDTEHMNSNALEVLQKINLRKSLTAKEMAALLELNKKEELAVLYEIANHVRQRDHGNSSCVHGIIEFSNYCRCNCFYCGIRKDRDIERYRMTEEEIVEVARHAVNEYGFKALVLQSGEDPFYTEEMLCRITKAIRQMGVLVFISVGIRTIDTYKKLYQAGARAVLMRFETSNPELFAKIRPGTNLADRIQLIKDLRAMGYVIATGFLVGLPGETTEDLVNNILLTKQLGPDMYSFGPLIPTSNTPFANESKVSVDLLLKIIATARFVDSQANILVTTALETLDFGARREGFMAGANSLMIDITPKQYKTLYSIYDNRSCVDVEVQKSIDEILDLLYELGRAPTDLGV